MIFVTVGTQLPFDRMVRVVDDWCCNHVDEKLVMQIGSTDYVPRHGQTVAFTKPIEWERNFEEADLIVSHAGMGTILKCLDYGKPLIVMPRLASLGEHRNDHQLATANKFKGFGGVSIAFDEDELRRALENPPETISNAINTNENLNRLIDEIRRFVLKVNCC